MKRASFLICLCCIIGPLARSAVADVPAWAKVSEAQLVAAKRLKVPVAFENHVGMRFVLIPSAKYRMGVWDDEARYYQGFGRPTPHSVTITKAFYLQITEVTNAQYQTAHPDHKPAPYEGFDRDGPQLPVTAVSHRNAVAFLKQLSAKDPRGRQYRLPTEAEWELAVHGDKGPIFWRYKPENAYRFENLARGDAPKGLEPVASREPLANGLYDMLGNAKEWTGDRFGPHPQHAVIDPKGPGNVDPAIAPLFRRRCCKGGSVHDTPKNVRRWARVGLEPSTAYALVGFRAVVPLTAEPSDEPSAPQLPLTLDTREAESGKRVPVENVYSIENGESVRMKPTGIRIQPRPSASFTFKLETGAQRRTFLDQVRPGEIYTFIRAAPPETKRVSFAVPLFRCMAVEGTVKLPKGPEIGDGIVVLERLAAYARSNAHGATPVAQAPIADDGSFRLASLPWIPGAPVQVQAKNVTSHGRRGYSAVRSLPAAWSETAKLGWEIEVRAMEPESPSFGTGFGVGGGGRELEFAKVRLPEPGTVHILCSGVAGEPLSGAVVARNARFDEHGRIAGVDDVAISDDEGYAHFPAVPPGESMYELYVPWRPVARAKLVARSYNVTPAELRIPASARIDLRVRRAEGGPAAWAAVTVKRANGREWYDLTPDGTLRVDPKLDHEGRHILSNVPPSPLTLSIRFHGRTVTETIEPKPGATLELELTLPEARHWGPGAK